MCRISGIVYKNSGDFAFLSKMLQHQVSGGPDAFGTFIDGNVGLAHNRLSILDHTTGSQPMIGDWFVLSFNGEIYNHLDIRAKLEPQLYKGHSDTETLLNAIEQKGINWTLEQAEGMFSFAAYDKYERKLYLVVDPYGIKPCFYYQDSEIFAFASSPGALSHVKDSWGFNYEALTDFLALGATREPLFSGMKRLESGHILTLKTDNFEQKKERWYFQKQHKTDPEDLISAVKQSILSTKLADVPVHLFLSGGVDSSVVASQLPGVGAVHLASPEEGFARTVAKKYDNPFIKIDPRDYSAEGCLKDYAEKSGDCSGASIIPYIVSKEVSSIGKVAISANGADELFVGYDRIEKESTSQQMKHIFRYEIYKKSAWWGYKDSRELELKTYVEYDLNKTLDFASMCHGLEVRVPYLNKSVVEKALSLDWDTHTNRGFRPKAILKKFLLEEGFDLSFVTRQKLGFSLFYSPMGYDELKEKGVDLLRDQFKIDPRFPLGSRDDKYFKASAASFYAWFQVWNHKLLL